MRRDHLLGQEHTAGSTEAGRGGQLRRTVGAVDGLRFMFLSSYGRGAGTLYAGLRHIDLARVRFYSAAAERAKFRTWRQW